MVKLSKIGFFFSNLGITLDYLSNSKNLDQLDNLLIMAYAY